jgi:hypothetical protein
LLKKKNRKKMLHGGGCKNYNKRRSVQKTCLRELERGKEGKINN